MRIIVLGGDLVGGPMVADLADPAGVTSLVSKYDFVVAAGFYTQPGIFPPEFLGRQSGC